MEALFKNAPLTMLIVTGALLGAVVFGGMAISLLSNLFTGFVARTSPSEKKLADWNNKQLKTTTAALDTPKPFSISPGVEPLLLSLGAFVSVFIVAQIFVTVQPEVKDCTLPKFDTNAECLAWRAKDALKIKQTKDQTGAATIIASLPAADATKGKALYEEKGCVGCHSLNKGQVVVGPSFYGVYTLAATRKPGYSPEEYIYESVVNPNLYVVQNFQPNLMPGNLVTTINKQEMADILAWMKTNNAQKD